MLSELHGQLTRETKSNGTPGMVMLVTEKKNTKYTKTSGGVAGPAAVQSSSVGVSGSK